MENKVIFHIGLPKTGTTAIQFLLYENASVLKEYGFFYPDFHVECDIQYDQNQTVKNGVADRKSVV